MVKQQELGQYFTNNKELRSKVVEFVLNEPNRILEPSVGQGDLVQEISEKKSDIEYDMYEIDKSINMLDGVPKNVIYKDFMKEEIPRKYMTIVGNPPFVRTKSGNLYIDFTEKCYNLLDSKGELIFIIPSDFFKLTSASKLLDNMLKNGSFTHIYHPHKENLFKNASIDVLIFRYCKDKSLNNEVLFNGELLYLVNNKGLVTFNEKKNTSEVSFKEYFDIYVGIVSGRKNIYKNDELGNIEVLNGDGKLERFIFIKKFPCERKEVNSYLLEHKKELLSRKIRKFDERNWFEWGAPRNMKSVKKSMGKDCIYVNNLTRKEKVAFEGKVTYFGGQLLILIPKKSCDLSKITKYINSEEFKKKFMYSNRFKIGHRQISNSYIPNEYL
tara:strand:+ start:4956 stop:6107 length:1152 start_codon:yes stop_codon:yes gene_type:complete